jgi:hypothetical protein
MNFRHLEWLTGEPLSDPDAILYELLPYSPEDADRIVRDLCALAKSDLGQTRDDPARAERVRQAFGLIVAAAGARQAQLDLDALEGDLGKPPWRDRLRDLPNDRRQFATAIGDKSARVAPPVGTHRDRPGATPAAARKRLQNVRSEIAFALDRYGLAGRRSYLAPLSPEAQALYHRLPTKYFHCALSRFLHFISAQGIPPDRVTDAVSRQFLTALERHSSIKNPRETDKNMCRVWKGAR